ncbi:hypothetical protein NIIDMKKI_57990 [Mycobacterium kansasii]|uniref:Uncharacterized protein n=1 Tax=Mycobacterium kansasii TaxID=1768 RepID=A0A7G1IKZ4_MYCKA|nr:hypothetical protein NIIDMKKI_57990 [Mycobacterium kansasii]
MRELLAATKSIDVDAATTAIRYPLRWHHVGLIMWSGDQGFDVDELPRLQRFLRGLGESVGADASPLFVAADRSSGWAWLPFGPPSPMLFRKSASSRCPGRIHRMSQ